MTKAGGLIPDPGYGLGRRIDKLEARVKELEKTIKEHVYGIREPEPEPVKEWRPKTKINLDFDNAFHNSSDEKIINKALPYILQLQWLLEHYPEETGKWSEKCCWSPFFSHFGTEWYVKQSTTEYNLSGIYMSNAAALHLAADMNSGKVRF